MDKYFDNTSLFKVVLKWKWHIIIITVVAAILGAIFSSSKFITPLYKSEAILYPSNVSAYSDETFTEQMLQIMQSQDIMDSVVKDFDLMGHYGIDINYKYWKTALIGEYRDNVSISRTPYDAVLVKVLDKDPEIACAMVKDIIRLYDQKVGKLHKIKRLEAVDMYRFQLDKKEQYIDSLRNRLNEIATNYGVISVPDQSREVSRGFISGSGSKTSELKKNLEIYGPEVIAITDLLESESEAYSAAKLDYEQELRFYNSRMTFSNVISEPFVSDKKAFPIRWVVVLLCGFAACLLSMVVVYIIELKNAKAE